MLAIDEVVAVHDGAYVGLGHGCFKGGEVEFAQGALVDDAVDAVTVVLRIVAGEMFYGGRDSLALNTFDVSHSDACGEEGIFAEVFHVAAVQWRAIDVHAWGQQEVNATRTGVVTKRCTDTLGQRRVPGRSQRDSRGVGRREPKGAHADRPV